MTKLRKNLIDVVCLGCGKNFKARPDFVAKGEAKYCNRYCFSMMQLFLRLGITIEDFRDRIEHLILNGMNFKQIAIEIGVKPTTISGYCKKFGLSVLTAPNYDWEEIKNTYYSGKTFDECKEKHGISKAGLSKAVKSGRLKKRSNRNTCLSFAEYAARRSGSRCKGQLRAKVLKENLLPYECAICKIMEWNDQPLTLRLDHISGDGRDHSLENLRFVCPNCDSQLPTYGHRNRGRYKMAAIT